MTRARDLADGADKDITGTLTLDDIVLSNDMSVADNGKVQFGAGNDLQIYHEASSNNSIIAESGSGNLRLHADDLYVFNAAGTSVMISALDTGKVGLGFSGSEKLATTSTGIDVTGTVTADGLISDSITNESSNLAIASTQSVTIKFDSDNNQTNREFNLQRNASTGILKAEESGDITFFADDGTTQALRWDASTQRLGLGTTSPSQLIDATATGSTTSVILAQNTTSNDGAAHLRAKNPQNELIIGTDNHSGGLTGTANASFLYTSSTTPIVIMPNGSEKVRITSGGNVGIGTSSPSRQLHINNASESNIRLQGGSDYAELRVKDADNAFSFHFGASERMRITSGGNVGISTTNPNYMVSLIDGTAMGLSDLADYSTKGILGNIHPSISSESLGSTSVDDVRNLGFGSTYTTSAGGTKPSSYGTIRVFEHYNSNLNKGARFISQVAVGHSNTPVWYARNSDTTVGTSYSAWYQFDMTSTSDERSKENVEDAPDQLAVVKQFQVKEFDYIDNADEPRQLGMMAQHVDTFAPEYVSKDAEDPDIMWRIKYNKMVPMLIKALQEATAKIETLETQRADLEARLTALEAAE